VKTPTFTVSNPDPTLTGLTPNSATTGGPGFKLKVTGTNFIPCSRVRWRGSNRPTTFISNTMLEADITEADLATVANASVLVFNPSPGGGTSNSLTFTINPRVVKVAAATAVPGGNVSIPIVLESGGDVNALGFSLTFDPAILSDPQATRGAEASTATLIPNTSQAAQGRFGLGLALPPGEKIAAGANSQIAVVTFTVAPNTTASSAQIGFADQPTAREVSDASARPLSATYQAGAVTITQNLEADVAPRPTGSNNGTVTITDWVQVCRFAAGLETPTAGTEFQRADCAPREGRGDGQLTPADCAQAGRYAVGLDPVTPAGGPTSPASTAAALAPMAQGAAASPAAPRLLRAVAGSSGPDQTRSLALELDAQGNENTLGLSLLFNPSEWGFVSAAAGRDAEPAGLYLNAQQAASGRVGLILALPAGQTLAAGTRQLIVFTFAATSGDHTRPLVFGFGDRPVAREVVDVRANPLPTTYARALANVSAASFRETELASEAIVSAFGSALATATQLAESLPLPTALAGTTVRIKDSEGIERLAPLFFVSPTQVNYQIPPGTAAGTATVTITSGDGSVSAGAIQIAPVAPSLFTANQSGQGVAAAAALRVVDGMQTYEPVAQFDDAQNQFVSRPLDLGPPTEQVYLLLFGTGIRHRSDLAAVSARIGGEAAEVLYAGPQGDFVGLDQINLRLPRSLAGRGEVGITLLVDGKPANTVQVHIK
jgi:uncharacterized protein (TIGR03437 family)